MQIDELGAFSTFLLKSSSSQKHLRKETKKQEKEGRKRSRYGPTLD